MNIASPLETAGFALHIAKAIEIQATVDQEALGQDEETEGMCCFFMFSLRVIYMHIYGCIYTIGVWLVDCLSRVSTTTYIYSLCSKI